MSKTIKITSGNKVISIESDDAGVPDVTEGTGPDLINLQDDAMAAPTATNAEFNAAEPAAATEKEEKPQEAEKANEAAIVAGLEKMAAKLGYKMIKSKESDEPEAPATEPEASAEPTTPAAEPAAETPAEGGNAEGAGEVTEGDGVTTIDVGNGVTVTISNSEAPAAEPHAEPDGDETPAPAAEPEAPAEGADPTAEPGAEPAVGAEADTAADQAIESFFANLGL